MDACDAVHQLLEDIASWKASLQGFGSSYDGIRIQLDTVKESILCTVEHANTVSNTGRMLADDMVDVLGSISETESPSNRTKDRMKRRLANLKRTCEDMIRGCQVCEENFNRIHDRLKMIGQDLDEKESELEKKLRELRFKKRKAWIGSIIACVVMVVAAAAAVATGFIGALAGGAAIDGACGALAVSASSALQCEAQISRLSLERNTLREISEGVFKGADCIAGITEWWHTVQTELIRFEALAAEDGITWGIDPETTYSMQDWEDLGRRFEEYSGRMGEFSHSKRSNSSRSQTT